VRLVERIVAVDASLTETWQALIKAEDWPKWMPVRAVDTSPHGKVDKSTSAVIRWNSGRPMSVVVTEFRPGRSFRWTGRVFGATVSYDHVATSAGSGSEILFILEASGPTAPLVARFLKPAYERALDEAVPKLRAMLASEHG
jgi:hypothetical protein